MKTNWQIIKDTYIAGNITQAEAAKQFKVTYDVLRRHASKEHWERDRQLRRSATKKMADEKKSVELAEVIAGFNIKGLNAADMGMDLVIHKLQQALKPAAKIESAEDLLEFLASQKGLGKELCDYQKAGLTAMGEKTGEEAPVFNINVKTEKAKKLTEELLEG